MKNYGGSNMKMFRVILIAFFTFLFMNNVVLCEELNIYALQKPSKLNSDKVIKQVIPSLLYQKRELGNADTIGSYRRNLRTNYELYDSDLWRLKNFNNSGALMFRLKNSSHDRGSMELSQQELQSIGLRFIEIMKDSGILQLSEHEEIRFNEINYIKNDISDASGMVVSSDKKKAIVEYRRFIGGIEVIGESLLRVHVSTIGEIEGFDLLWRPILEIEGKVNVSFSNVKSSTLSGMKHRLCYFEKGCHKIQDKIQAVYEVKPDSGERKTSRTGNEVNQTIVFDAITGDVILSNSQVNE